MCAPAEEKCVADIVHVRERHHVVPRPEDTQPAGLGSLQQRGEKELVGGPVHLVGLMGLMNLMGLAG